MSRMKFQLKNDEYEYQNVKNVLPISDIPLSLIPKGPPKTGEIYLRLVHEEAKKCPKVVRKALPESEEKIITKETKNVNYLRKFFNRFEEEKEKEKKSNQLIPSYLKASNNWKNSFIKEFKYTRNIFNKNKLPDNYIKEIFPSLEDESNWKVYLYGKSKRGLKKINLNSIEKENDLEIEEMLSLEENTLIVENDKKRKYNKLLNNNSNNKKICIKNELINNNCDIRDNFKDIDRKRIEGRHPLLSIVKQMNQKIINKIIYYHSIWIQNSFSRKQFQWLFALLIGLDPLLTSSQVSILREICKLCKSHREELYKDAIGQTNNEELDDNTKNDLVEKVAPLNIIITIITVFFSQSDLE